jgi:hypothetical protein
VTLVQKVSVKNPYDLMGCTMLRRCGLNMQALLSMAELPEQVRLQIQALLPADAGSGTLLLLGNGGQSFWRGLPEGAWARPEPLDSQSIIYATEFVEQSWPDSRYKLLYPSQSVVGLQQLGKLAGWHYPSPLMLGINPVFGLWYAYRALVWLEQALPSTSVMHFRSPCEQCEDQPCVSACPAGALQNGDRLLQDCMDFRLQPNSICQDNCLARMRCPVASEHRYSPEQMAYHYRQSYATLLNWRS